MANCIRTFQNPIYFDKYQPHVSIWTGGKFTKKLEIDLSCFGALNQKLQKKSEKKKKRKKKKKEPA
jgi:hypothetical protein